VRKVSSLFCVALVAASILRSTESSQCAAQYNSLPTSSTQATSANNKTSLTRSISSGFKRGVDKISKALKPKTPVKSEPDEISLATKANPTAELYTAVARLYQQSGKYPQAEEQFKKALEHTPNHLGALLDYARLKETLSETAEASKLYQQAAKAHPDQAPVFNNMGAFYSRQANYREAIAALNRAIELQPRQAKYRNNMAVVLVDMGRTKDAFTHLRAVASDPVAYYNLGYLLAKRMQTQAAAQHFKIALQLDPSMAPARQMLSRLASYPRQPVPAPIVPPDAEVRLGAIPKRLSQARVSPPKVTEPPAAPIVPPRPQHPRPEHRRSAPSPMSPQMEAELPLPPSPLRSIVPRRLPPTRNDQMGLKSAPQPAAPRPRPPIPTAPMPPQPMQGPALQPLPSVD